jgi:hypothetical protein
MTDQNECVKEQCETPFTSSKLMSSLIAHDLKSKESAEMRDILYELLGLARRAEKLFGCCGSSLCSDIAKYRHPEYPNEWFLTDFTMVQVEGRLRLLEEQNKRMFLVCKMALGFLQMFLDQNCTDECKSYAKNLQENLVGVIGGGPA